MSYLKFTIVCLLTAASNVHAEATTTTLVSLNAQEFDQLAWTSPRRLRSTKNSAVQRSDSRRLQELIMGVDETGRLSMENLASVTSSLSYEAASLTYPIDTDVEELSSMSFDYSFPLSLSYDFEPDELEHNNQGKLKSDNDFEQETVAISIADSRESKRDVVLKNDDRSGNELLSTETEAKMENGSIPTQVSAVSSQYSTNPTVESKKPSRLLMTGVATGAFAIVALGVYVIKKRRNMNANMNS